VTAGSKPGIDLLALPVSFFIITCNRKDREHYLCFRCFSACNPIVIGSDEFLFLEVNVEARILI